jgi:AraC-like DNA-binding protein
VSSPVSFADHYTKSDYAAFAPAILSLGQRNIDLIHVVQDTNCIADPAIPQLAIAGCVGVAEGFRGRCHLGDGWHDYSYMRARDIVFGAANCEMLYDVEGAHEFLIMAIPLPNLTEAFQVEAAAIESAQMCLLPKAVDAARQRRHEMAFQLIEHVFQEAQRGSVAASLLVDSTAIALAALLLGEKLPIHQQITRQVDPRLSRVIDFIEANLAMPLRLNDLAAVVCISSYHFARSFKAATGLTPHNYVQLRRITRAKELLARTRLPIAQVAADVGFASQAHMTDVFREKVGATPAKYRSDQA